MVFGEEGFKGKGEGRVSILEILQGSLSKSVECNRGGAEDVTGSQMLSQQDTGIDLRIRHQSAGASLYYGRNGRKWGPLHVSIHPTH